MDIINLTVLLLACALSVELCKVIECGMNGVTHLKPEDVDPTLCTHIIFSYDFESNEKLMYPNNANGKELMTLLVRLHALKKKNSGLKIILNIQPDTKDDFFYTMYRDSKMRSQFIQETINYLRSGNLDGVRFITDVQTWQRKIGTDKPSYVALLQEMSLAFSKESKTAKKPALSLSVSIPSNAKLIERELDIAEIAKYVDFIFVNTFFTRQEFDSTNLQHNCPLYGEDESDTKSLDYYARYLTAKGVENQKLVFGLHFYAGFYLYGMHANNPGYRYYGLLRYIRICELFKKKVPLFDEARMILYFQSKDDAFLYNDQIGLRIKVIYIKSHGYGGVGVSLYSDDSGGVCSQGKFPLLTAVFNECRGIS